jgi:hypothetical protein
MALNKLPDTQSDSLVEKIYKGQTIGKIKYDIISGQLVVNTPASNTFNETAAFVFQLPYITILDKIYCSCVAQNIGGLVKPLNNFQVRVGGIAGSIEPNNAVSGTPTFGTGCSLTRFFTWRSNIGFIDVENLNLYQNRISDINIDLAAYPDTAFIATDSIFFNIQLYFRILE